MQILGDVSGSGFSAKESNMRNTDVDCKTKMCTATKINEDKTYVDKKSATRPLP